MRGLAKPLIDLLIEKGVDLGSDDGVLFAALYHTVECRLQRVVGRYLFDRGARADLVFAAALGERELVESMFRADGSLNSEGRGEWRNDYSRRSAMTEAQLVQEALVWASMNGRSQVIDSLLARGADINGMAKVSRWDITPLHGAAWGAWPETCADLMDRRADHTIVDPVEQCTAVDWATYCRRAEVIELFRLRCYLTLSTADAIEIGDERQVEAALAGIEDVDAPPGVTASRGVLLRVAAYAGRAEVVRMLLEHGADPTLANDAGVTARDIAEREGHAAIVELLTIA